MSNIEEIDLETHPILRVNEAIGLLLEASRNGKANDPVFPILRDYVQKHGIRQDDDRSMGKIVLRVSGFEVTFGECCRIEGNFNVDGKNHLCVFTTVCPNDREKCMERNRGIHSRARSILQGEG